MINPVKVNSNETQNEKIKLSSRLSLGLSSNKAQSEQLDPGSSGNTAPDCIYESAEVE